MSGEWMQLDLSGGEVVHRAAPEPRAVIEHAPEQLGFVLDGGAVGQMALTSDAVPLPEALTTPAAGWLKTRPDVCCAKCPSGYDQWERAGGIVHWAILSAAGVALVILHGKTCDEVRGVAWERTRKAPDAERASAVGARRCFACGLWWGSWAAMTRADD